MELELIGVGIAKRVFQVCGVDASGAEVLRKRLSREGFLPFLGSLPPPTVALEACAGAHHWGRELEALGHRVRLLPPRYVKSYVWGNKTDAADAAAICRACGDARIHDVAVKSVDQQGVLALHRARDLLVRQRTTLGNALRAHLSEFGIVAPQGRAGLSGLRTLVCEGGVPGVSAVALAALEALSSQWSLLDRQVRDLERAIVAHHKEDEVSRRLATIPGIGPITATALAATVGTVGDASAFRTGRHLAAWLGLTPREHSSGLKRRQGGIGKRGDAYLRRLLILGAHAHMRSRKRPDPWLEALKTRKPAPVAAGALANKTARIAWAVMARGETYNRPLPTA